MFDVVIRGGKVIDGSGGAPAVADVAIEGGRIAEVGADVGGAKREIDASGLLVTPGFVDVHTHYDGQVSWDPYITPSSFHGVTTVVMGNCGVGFAPVRPDTFEWLIALMEGVEDIPGSVLSEGIDWAWEGFPAYLDAIERIPHAIDFAAQLPHAALRAYVMGERGADHTEAPSADEIAEMARLASEAVTAGALGFTTSRTVNHRASDGRLTPTLTATFDELRGIARGLRSANAGVIELVADFDDLETEFAMLRRVAEECGRLISISILQDIEDPEKWKRLLALISDACAAGVPMRGQVSTRPVGAMLSLHSWLHPFMGVPSFRKIEGRPHAEIERALGDPTLRAAILAEHAEATGAANVENTIITGFSHMFELGDPPEYYPSPEASVAARARRDAVPPAQLALDLLLLNGGTQPLYVPVKNYAEFNSDVTQAMLEHPHTVPGLGDGGAHCTIISDASFPTTLLSHWGRDHRDPLPLEWLVKRHTNDTASLVGLGARGRLEPGLRADVNLLDFDALQVLPPQMVADLPAGGKRLLQRAEGYRATLVAGEVVFEDGEPTGALPGTLVRGARGPLGPS